MVVGLRFEARGGVHFEEQTVSRSSSSSSTTVEYYDLIYYAYRNVKSLTLLGKWVSTVFVLLL